MKRLPFTLLLIAVAVAGFALGRATGDRTLADVVNSHRDFPLFPAPPKPDAAVVKADESANAEKDIVLEVPVDNATVSETFFDVAGRAKTAGGPVHIVLRGEQGEIVLETAAAVESVDGELYGRFGKTVMLPMPRKGKGTVEVFRQGGEKIVRTIMFGTADSVTLKAFFPRNGADDCGLVTAVERTVSSRSAIYRSALEELLKGPSDAEVQAGFLTSIPRGVTVKSVAANAEGVVSADFSETLDRNVAGSCRVESIRAQIVSTLKQFPEVRDVIISVNGRTDDILQP